MTDVCGVLVSYKPSKQMLDNLAALLRQTSAVVVVDNGSPEAIVSWLRQAGVELGFHLIENAGNVGIAAALNQGVRWSIAQGFLWVALFDQDSQVTDGYMAAMSAASEAPLDPQREIAIYCPRYVDREGAGERSLFYLDEYGEPLVSMTSGSVMRTALFDKLGFFSEELFIYCVDDEFCLRARSHGYRLLLVPSAVLLHKEGASRVRKVLGFCFYVTGQPAKKRYYIMRNQLWVHCRYPRTYPARGAPVQNFLRLVKVALRVLALEGDRLAKAGAMMRGSADFMRNRMGKTIEL